MLSFPLFPFLLPDGIRQHIKAVLYERKRMINLGHSYERKSKKIRESGSESSESASTSAGNDTDILSDDDSSSDTSNEAIQVWRCRPQISQGHLG